MNGDTTVPRAEAPMAGPRAALFDVEGVIAFPDRTALAAGLAAIDPGLGPERLAELRHAPDLYPLWERFSRGDVSSQAYWAAVLDGAGLPSGPGDAEAMGRLQARVTWALLDEGVLALADALRAAGWRVGLLSNSCVDYEPQIARFAPRFDVAHFSHRTGLRKPDAAAYLAAAEALGSAPEGVLFVDDKDRNVQAALRLGMRAHRYEGLDLLVGALGAAEARP